MKQVQKLRPLFVLGVTQVLLTPAYAQGEPAPANETVIRQIFQGAPTRFQDYLVQDAAASVSAAELAGIAPSAIQVMENTRDFTLYVKGLNGDGQGGGFAITPARIKNPIPAITVEQYKHNAWYRVLAAMTISYAQGSSETEGKKYKRRALSIASNWYPFAVPEGTGAVSDDPVYQSILSGEDCLKSFSGPDASAPRPQRGRNTGKSGPVAPDYDSYDKTVAPYIQTCSAAKRDQVAARWYRPVVSFSLGTGDVGVDGDNSSSVGMGNHATVALRYGAAFNAKEETPDNEKPTDSISGWAFYLSHKATRNAPVVATLGTPDVGRTSSSTTAARLSIGQASWRALIEASTVREKQASMGEQSLKRAIGLEYQVGKSAWLHVRYGKKRTISGQGEENAGLLSMTFGPEALQF